jgi:hypothetical protein
MLKKTPVFIVHDRFGRRAQGHPAGQLHERFRSVIANGPIT